MENNEHRESETHGDAMSEIEGLDTDYLIEALKQSQLMVKGIAEMTPDQVFDYCSKLILDKQYLKAVVQFQKDKIIKLQTEEK